MHVVEADLTWTGARFERGVRIIINDAGRIDAVTRGGDAPATRLAGQALLPGFVSAHSHAFQRALRGRGENFPAGSGTFWSWREAMYTLVRDLDAESFYTVAKATFEEMVAAGITAVGEFHYLHHSPTGADYAFDEIVARAAAHAGIRIVLLMTYYQTGGINQPLTGPQKRFETRSVDEFFRQVDTVAARLDPRLQSIGVAAHSIRGVPPEHVRTLYVGALERGIPFHMHVEEQRKEIDDSMQAYGRTPMELINELLPTCEGFTAVHATHSEADDLRRFIDRGGNVCITPLTEANLGDGMPEISAIRADRLSLGTDSNARISMIEEMRWLEYAHRLKSETRGVFAGSGRDLLDIATSGGARALGIEAGVIAPGAHADFVSIDLGVRTIAGIAEENLLDAIVFGGGNDVVRGTFVGGNWRPAR